MAIAETGFSGKIGNLIYYKVGNQTRIRIAPSRVRQTKATKARASEFGLASTMGSAIRQQLFSVIPNPTDNKMQTRLVSLLFQWLHPTKDGRTDLASQLRHIHGFDFTDSSSTVKDRWKVSIQLINPSPGLMQIKIPAFIPSASIVAPSNTVSVICKIALGVCDVATGGSKGGDNTELSFEYDKTPVAAQTISMKLPTPRGSLIVLGASIQYMINKNGNAQPIRNKAYMPAGIVQAMYV